MKIQNILLEAVIDTLDTLTDNQKKILRIIHKQFGGDNLEDPIRASDVFHYLDEELGFDKYEAANTFQIYIQNYQVLFSDTVLINTAPLNGWVLYSLIIPKFKEMATQLEGGGWKYLNDDWGSFQNRSRDQYGNSIFLTLMVTDDKTGLQFNYKMGNGNTKRFPLPKYRGEVTEQKIEEYFKNVVLSEFFKLRSQLGSKR